MAQVCIDQTLLFTYSFLLVCIIVIAFYSIYREHVKQRYQVTLNERTEMNVRDVKPNERATTRNERDTTRNERDTTRNVSDTTRNVSRAAQNDDDIITKKFLEKIYNPLAPPENVYPSRNYDGYKRYQEIGYITSDKGQFPVFARYKYAGKTDRYEYYTITDSRNRIKIPFNIKNFNEVYDGDQVTIPDLGTFVFRKYPYEGLRYDHNNIY